LSAEQFRALARLRGYSLAALARLWGLSRARVSQIAADPGRAAHYDFALRGTPRNSRRGGSGAAPDRALAARAAQLEIGEIFVVRESPGDHLPEGGEGVVAALSGRGERRYAQLCFEGGSYRESFEVAYLLSPLCFLVRTGRVEPHAEGHRMFRSSLK
jgi:hypothetical protein